MSSQNIEITKFESVAMEALEKYKEEAGNVIGEVLEQVGMDSAIELQQTSPKRTGAYAKSWTFGMYQSRGSRKKNKLIVFNRKYYRLVHLLEKGHAKRNGGRVEGIPHVEPVRKKAEKEAINQIKAKLEDLGV